jgi:adenylate cyclase
MKRRYNAIVGFSAAAVFAFFYIIGALSELENRLYDFFLNFRANRQRIDNVVFLDVDDPAIAYNGVFPWPRSIPAEGLLKLKEYGVIATIFDIEYIDRGPQGVDSLYLNQGLGNDFDRSFSEIDSAAADIFSSLSSGRIARNDISSYAKSLSSLINSEKESLYTKAQGIARDNDLYLAKAMALNGNVWSTINLWEYVLDGEQAERRPIAEELFSYPVKAAHNVHRGAGFINVLPSLPIFAEASKGAGFTNVEIDNDGIRRRVYLTQNVQDHWYLQLAFAPLIDYLGSPEVILGKRKLTIKEAQLPARASSKPGLPARPDERKNIVIPLDQKGRMMLDWPKEDYHDSYKHVSFAEFSLLDEIEAELAYYSRALSAADRLLFARFDQSINRGPIILNSAIDLFDLLQSAKNDALESLNSGDFGKYVQFKEEAFAQLRDIIALDVDVKITELAEQLSIQYPQNADDILDEADYIAQLMEIIKINSERREELRLEHNNLFANKFCIIGRVDTGTTDYGANPFHGKYINVGTHGVVLDTILSESFIIPLGIWWRVIFLLILVPAFFIFTARLSPVMRASVGFGAALLIFIIAIILFRLTGIYWGPLGAIFAMIVAIITREVIAFAGSEKEKQFIRTAFSTYVSDDVVKELIADPSRLQLGGVKRYMTAIFTDVKGFSTISEKLDPEGLVTLLNQYLSAMSDIVLEEKGTIDKYEGDAIIAFFGAPQELKDHALRACVSAIRMKKIEAEINKKFIEEKMSPGPLLTRIGINTGDMVAGNMGTGNKMNYTIMGNAVNLSARLEGVNKQYGTWILASLDTVKETGEALLYRKLDRVRVVGINEPVRLCELLDLAAEAGEQQKKLVSVFHEALFHFENRDWDKAAEGFKQALAIAQDDEPSKMYLERCEQFKTHPPKPDWDGVYNLTSK